MEATREALEATVQDLADLQERERHLSDVEAVDLMRGIQRLIHAAEAAQSVLTRVVHAHRAASGTERSDAEVLRGVAGEVALARRLPASRAQRLVRTALALASDLPATATVFASGDATERQVTALALETECLGPEDRRRIDEELAPRLASLTERQVTAEATAAVVRATPTAARARIEAAEARRRVTMRPESDCMVRVSALLPVAAGTALHQELHRSALSLNAAGDPRTLGQAMADTLVERVLATPAGPEEGGAAARRSPRVEVHLVMTDLALLGVTDTPARLRGHGTIPAAAARVLIGAAADGDTAWLRRLYTEPGTGELVAMESSRRRFSEGMKTFLTDRDGWCREPYCDAVATEPDHVQPVRAGGVTAVRNGQAACRMWNLVKEEPGWSSTVRPDGAIVITTPTGHDYVSPRRDVPFERGFGGGAPRGPDDEDEEPGLAA